MGDLRKGITLVGKAAKAVGGDNWGRRFVFEEGKIVVNLGYSIVVEKDPLSLGQLDQSVSRRSLRARLAHCIVLIAPPRSSSLSTGAHLVGIRDVPPDPARTRGRGRETHVLHHGGAHAVGRRDRPVGTQEPRRGKSRPRVGSATEGSQQVGVVLTRHVWRCGRRFIEP